MKGSGKGGKRIKVVYEEDGGQFCKSHDETLFVHADEPKTSKSSSSHEAATGLL